MPAQYDSVITGVTDNNVDITNITSSLDGTMSLLMPAQCDTLITGVAYNNVDITNITSRRHRDGTMSLITDV